MNHATKEQLNLLLEGRLDDCEASRITAHMEKCPECALLFAELAEGDLLPMPPALYEDINTALRAERARSLKKEYAAYCLRVGAAVCASLVLVFSGGFSTSHIPSTEKPITTCLSECTAKIEDYFDQLFNKLSNLEVPIYADKKE